jgi:hypothetical protein
MNDHRLLKHHLGNNKIKAQRQDLIQIEIFRLSVTYIQ